MINKEKQEYLIKKWNFMLNVLNSKKSSQTKFAKMFETTSLHNDTQDLKLVFPILQKLLYSIPNIKTSASHKTELIIASIERDMIIDSNTIMVDAASAFIRHVIDVANNKFNEEEFKVNHIRLTDSRNKISISIIY